MRVKTVGGENPDLAIIGGIHGDEPCGIEVVERLSEQAQKFAEPVKLIVANEKAAERGVRYTEADLNRSWPGSPDSEVHEERLAARIIQEIEGMRGVALHSTRSTEKPFLFFDRRRDVRKIVEPMPVDYAVDISAMGETVGLAMQEDFVELETGVQGTEGALERSYSRTVQFLRNMGIWKGRKEFQDKEYFRMYGRVEGGGYEFVAENFRTLEKNEVFARRGSEKLRAEEEFTPILMSDNGYKDKVGMKGRSITESEAWGEE